MVQRKLDNYIFGVFFTYIKLPVMVGPHQLFQAGQVSLKQRRVLPDQRQVSVHRKQNFMTSLPAEIWGLVLPDQRQVSVHRKQNFMTSLPAEIWRWVLPHQRYVSVHRKQNFMTSLPAEIWRCVTATPETGFCTPETEFYDVTSGRNVRASAAKPKTGFCTPETELDDVTPAEIWRWVMSQWHTRDVYVHRKQNFKTSFRQKYERWVLPTRNRFPYPGNRTARRHFRQKYEDEYCHTRDRFLYTGNRTSRLHCRKRWVLLHQKQVSVHRKQKFKTSLPA